MDKSFIYKGFEIRTDNIYGYSGIDRMGNWMLSSPSIQIIKDTIDDILKADEERLNDESSN